MARITFRVQPTIRTAAQLIKGVKRAGSRVWVGRVAAQASSVSKGIGNMLVGKFNNSVVAKSLRGNGTEDLPAHFGLSDGTANALADGMAELIRNSVHILGGGVGGVMSIKIQAVENDWNQYLSLPGAQHISQPSKITVPVVRWLLIDPNIDIGQAAYDIVFKGDDDKLDVRINKVSLSGRAIMVALSSLGGGSGYVLPSIVSGQNGQNFIEYTLRQQGVAIEAAAILIKKVR